VYSPRIVTYCGAGVSASSDAFVLALLGARDVAVYDDSLEEWARDASLPMESGPAR
jgi:thiosulfate/3-mercaptopyruvate sulfurtransferase